MNRKFINIFFKRNFFLIGFIFFPLYASNNILLSSGLNYKLNKFQDLNYEGHQKNKLKNLEVAEINWEKIKINKNLSKIKWEKIDKNYNFFQDESSLISNDSTKLEINSLNRSIVFDNNIIGPDISWLVPPGFKWNTRFKFDLSTRGHNRRAKGKPFLGWNSGDAVGQFYYQPVNYENYSFGLNIGMRSVYSGSASGGSSAVGEGLSLGFRADKRFSNRSGVAIGAEQLIHFDGLTDTGRDLYITVSKGWWSNNQDGVFPLNIATFGFATGKMAEGNVKGLCSNLFGGSGTEVHHQRKLCWAPVFTLSQVYNHKLSSFFEYNSKWFLLGTSIAPFKEIPLRGTFAIQLSDHIENYKLNSFEDLKWVFRLSLGF
ncbi:hypothetical protein HA150_07110 [Prochlorococcus marinus XMU1414]|uniref:Uncharacterized protein n=1 Tax=Prochlorococcus marinus XMU1424 TaxID=2774497 RepID=A0A9D9G311_PROMR|nr:hypothetical protein [Prochlorococcus marinus]MBO8228668.1 hypothetical protein [Prochlorococcus marinus XMU1414]MBW3046147.1 hypothetical protein [Prochlorococcus marinus str. MU1414]MCR8531561.1 hypothetical protein [Prochlorococcus marinus XMU1420]MCR8535290.1 hypothetical protein [Prochlorococcus marinus XMU1424]